MNLIDIEKQYKNNEIDKQEYIQIMHNIHCSLFKYKEFIKGKDIEKIEITKNNVIITSQTNSIKMICDKDDQRIAPLEILNFGYYEKNDFNMVMNLIDEGDSIFDIGANVGWYSLNIAKAIKNTKVLAFEPIPKTFDYLKTNVEMNQLNNIKIFNFGFSNEEKEIEFYFYKEGSGNASLANLSNVNTTEKVKCIVQRIDTFMVMNNYSIDFIKCDVEGAELLVFKGGIETIKRDKPIIYTEMLRKWSSKFNYHPNEIIEMLANIGYRCFTVKDNYLVEFYKMDDTTTETNFYFLHEQKHIAKIKKFSLWGYIY